MTTSSTTRTGGVLLLTVLVSIHCDTSDDISPFSSVSGARFAVVRTDFVSTSIAVLDDEGEILDPAVLSSGVVSPGLTTALSGDVVLASAQNGDSGVLNVIDRQGVDVVTWYDLTVGEVRGQLRVANGDFSTNPHDVAIVADERAWVSRYAVNLDEQDADNQANDIVEINPTTLRLSGRRVSLDPFNRVVEDTNGGSQGVMVYARPSRLVLVSDTLVVGLDLLSFGFDAAAPGEVALMDLRTPELSLTGFGLPETSRNCGNVQAVPGADDLVMVACIGFAQPFNDVAQRRASSGVYVLRITDGAAELVSAWEPGTDDDLPLAVTNLVPLSSTRFVGVAPGLLAFGGEDMGEKAFDEALVVDISTEQLISLFVAGGVYVIGQGAYDPASGLLLVPNGSDRSIRRYEMTGSDELEADDPVVFDDGPLPPTNLYLVP